VNPDLAAVHVLSYTIPEAVLVTVACLLFIGATLSVQQKLSAAMALAGLFGAIFVFLVQVTFAGLPALVHNGPLSLDPLALFVKGLALLGGIALVLLSWDDVPAEHEGEFYGCLLLAVAGLGLVGAANELVTLFLALELISIPSYILLYLTRSDGPGQEAAMKYFLLSIFSSALMLFGFSYLYGLTGTTYIPDVLRGLAGEGPAVPTNVPAIVGSASITPALVQVALVLVVAGLGFKLTAVPFHFYAPDVYQGTSNIAAAFLAFLPKAAGVAALIRLLGFVVEGGRSRGLATDEILGNQVPTLLWILAAVTMTLGNTLALLQDNVKRILAYSSVAHAGYMLIGLAAAPSLKDDLVTGGIEAVLYYLVAYTAMTVGAFAALAYLSTAPRPIETVDDLAGVSRTQPGIALLLALFLFSLIGLPLTAGFIGKMLLFLGALSVPIGESAWLFRGLAVIGALNAAAGAWYYLRIVAVMYLRDPVRAPEPKRAWPGLAALWLCAAVTLGLGVWPEPLMRLVTLAASR
jgi:NADH-quinone oxidoreductase subunit N